jgi:beta-glucosidase
MTDRTASLPSSFLWGTATSAYQIEGDGRNTDWWRFEHAEGSPTVEPCGDACDSWRRYEEDLDIVQSLGLNAYRFSIEWARIEPQQGTFSQEALAHYRQIIEACHRRSIVAVVTLHHFTLPLWAADAGGFENPDIASWMATYARAVGEALGDHIDVACTVNEPNIVALMGYLLGHFPPAVTDWDRFSKVNRTMRACHVAMRDALREGPGTFPIGFCLSMQEWEAVSGGEDLLTMMVSEMEDEYLSALSGDDFVGVQCYTKIQLGPEGLVPATGELTEMGYLFWPQCVEHTVRRAALATDLPIVVTENGIGTNDDTQRIRYLEQALRGVKNVQDDGIDVRGYFQWSLLDNFEWALGYGPKFGIVSVDRTTFARSPKPSAAWYADTTRNFPAGIS